MMIVSMHWFLPAARALTLADGPRIGPGDGPENERRLGARCAARNARDVPGDPGKPRKNGFTPTRSEGARARRGFRACEKACFRDFGKRPFYTKGAAGCGRPQGPGVFGPGFRRKKIKKGSPGHGWPGLPMGALFRVVSFRWLQEKLRKEARPVSRAGVL